MSASGSRTSSRSREPGFKGAHGGKSRGAGAALLTALLLASAAVSLGSCGFLNTSAFPPDLSLLEAQYDLAPLIPEEQAMYYNLDVVDAGGTRFVILTTSWPESTIPLIVFDGDLVSIQQFSASEVSIAGRGIWADAGDPTRIVIGNTIFSVDGTGQLVPDMTRNNGSKWDFGFAARPADLSPNFNVANITAEGGPALSWWVWPVDWIVTAGPPAAPLAYTAMIGSSTDSFNLEGVFSDPAAETATLVLMDKKNKTEYFVTMSWADFQTPCSPLLEKYSKFERAPLRADLLDYAQGLFIGFVSSGADTKVGDFIRFDYTGTTKETGLHFTRLPEIRTAYPIAGDAYYTYDREKRTVSKLAPWWTQ